MPKLLAITASPRGAHSVSTDLTHVFVETWKKSHPTEAVVVRDLDKTEMPYVDLPWIAGAYSPVEHRTPEMHNALAVSDELIGELQAADHVVIGTPMYNFAVPSVLKAWIDQIVRIHRSFVSTPTGKVGRLRDRPVIVVVASGGWFSGPSPTGTPPQPDFLTPYLSAVLNTIGITDIHFLTLEGVTRGPAMLQRAISDARDALSRLPLDGRV